MDFVAIKDGYTEYYQVADSVMGGTTLDRELKSLNSIRDPNPKYLLTTDNIPNASHNGIKQLYVLDWLLDKQICIEMIQKCLIIILNTVPVQTHIRLL